MRFARYRRKDLVRAGVVVGDRVHDVAELDPAAPSDVPGLLAGGPALWRALAAALPGDAGSVPLDEVDLLAPIERPGKYLAVGNNSPSHLAEVHTDRPSPELVTALAAIAHVRAGYPSPRFPTVFNKQTTCVTGPFDPIWLPCDAPTLDYEGELVLVIGARARRLTPEAAASAIAGYTVTNDVSVREWQIDTPLMWFGKSFETHGPIGPWVVTSDELEPDDLRVRTWVNDDLRQDGTTAEWIHRPAAVVSLLSQVCTLEPGDLIAMGTPAGVGIIHGDYLAEGDRVRVEIEGVGAIENRVVAEPV